MTRRSVRATLAFAFALFASVCSAVGARAEDRRVVVLMARGAPPAPWPEATQAVIAELAARNYQVIVESSAAKELAGLLEQLKAASQRGATVAAVAVVRDGAAGVAYVWTQRDANVVQVTADSNEGAVAEGALALRVTELVRAREQPAPSPPVSEKAPSPAPAAAEPRPAPKAEAPEQRESTPLLLWLGGGPTFAAGSGSPLVAGALGLRIPLSADLGLELGASASITPLSFNTAAGKVDIAARQATAHLLFEPWSSSTLNLALGAGLGAVWLDQTANAKPGYEARSDDVIVGVASVRARGSLQSGNVAFLLTVEPGVLLPAASVRASGEELTKLGQPWTAITAGFGWLIR